PRTESGDHHQCPNSKDHDSPVSQEGYAGGRIIDRVPEDRFDQRNINRDRQGAACGQAKHDEKPFDRAGDESVQGTHLLTNFYVLNPGPLWRLWARRKREIRFSPNNGRGYHSQALLARAVAGPWASIAPGLRRRLHGSAQRGAQSLVILTT